MKIEEKTSILGFDLRTFNDFYGASCSIQKSSLAMVDAIGIDDADPKIMASQAEEYGVKTNETTGWVPYPIPEAVLLNTRMHLTTKQVAQLIPILQKFVETGDL